MSAINKRGAPGTTLIRWSSRGWLRVLSDDAELELEDIYRGADRRLEEVFGYAVTQGEPAELRLQQLGERLC